MKMGLNHLDQCFSDWGAWEHMGGALLREVAVLSGVIFKKLIFTLKPIKKSWKRKKIHVNFYDSTLIFSYLSYWVAFQILQGYEFILISN